MAQRVLLRPSDNFFGCDLLRVKPLFMPVEIAPADETLIEDEDIEDIRDRYRVQKSKAAIQKLKDAIKQGHYLRSYLVKYVTDGKDRFREDLVAFWQNVALVSALIGALAVTILLTSPSRQDALADTGKVTGDKDSILLSQLYYALFGTAALTEIGAVLIVTIAVIHFNLMVTEDDMVWFMMTWGWFVDDVCQVFVAIGCFALFFGCFIGAFIVGNNTTGIIISSIGGTIAAIILPIWILMINMNKRRERESIERVRQIMFSRSNKQ